MKILLLNGSPRPKGNTAAALDEMEAVFAAEGVQLADDVSNLHLLAVYAGRNTFLEGHGNVLTLIRCFLRGIA